MYFHLRLSALLFISFATFQVQTQAGPDAPIVVELFTSQGCYSCPPADELMGKLKGRGNVIALSCHVTYWNYLGWKDTFSDAFCDKRQRNYQAHLTGNPGVYTPQIVVSGRYGAIGSRASRIKHLITVADKNTPLQHILLSVANDGQLKIELPNTQTDQKQQLLLLGTTGSHRLSIAGGENGGNKLNYHNPIEYVSDLGSWKGSKKVLSNEIAEHSNIKEWVVIAQKSPIGAITAAGKLTLTK
jgi:hypothetical protein